VTTRSPVAATIAHIAKILAIGIVLGALLFAVYIALGIFG
jgi:hypothetical protein